MQVDGIIGYLFLATAFIFICFQGEDIVGAGFDAQPAGDTFGIIVGQRASEAVLQMGPLLGVLLGDLPFEGMLGGDAQTFQ